MPNIERFVRQSLADIAQRLGLRPKHFSTPQEAEIAAIKSFLNANGPPNVLNLTPSQETKPDQSSPDVEK